MSVIESLFSLQGRTAVVIGGTGELCGAMAEGLAGAGAEVVLAGRSEAKAEARLQKIHAAGGRGYFVPVEATERSSVEALLEAVRARSGACQILVNGAGTNSSTPFLDIPEDEYDRIMNVNVKSVVIGCQIFGRYFIDQKISASVINLGSMSGLVPLSRVFTYSMSKAAIHNLSKNLAREWAPHGIRVNTLVPGFFPAEQNRAILAPERVDKILGRTPMQRFGEAQELIGATLLLASAKAGGFITGTEMVVDGGFACMAI